MRDEDDTGAPVDEVTAEMGERVRRGARHLMVTCIGVILLAAGTAGAVAITGDDATASSPPSTRQVVVRPVTAAGLPAPGYRATTDTRPAVSCTRASWVAVDPGIAFCGATADNTLACWRSATPHRVLCLTDPFALTLRSIRLAGAFPTVRPVASPVPQALLLDDGRRFLARDGGAWTGVRDHPHWDGWYLERTTYRHAVYGPADGDGIDRSHGLWRVWVYGDTAAPGTSRRVAAAYWVGTAR